MSAEGDSSSGLDIRAVIHDGLGVLARNGLRFVLLAVAVQAIPHVLLGLSQARHPTTTGYYLGVLAGALVQIFIGAFVQGALIYAAMRDLEGQPAPVSRWLSAGARNWLWLVGLSILEGLAYGVGLLLLIVPGIFLALRWMVAAQAVVVEAKGVRPAMGRSAALADGRYGAILGLFLFLAGAAVALALLSASVVRSVPLNDRLVVRLALNAVAGSLLAVLASVMTTALYRGLRRAEGSASDALAEVFA
jgi:hypothetical protein